MGSVQNELGDSPLVALQSAELTPVCARLHNVAGNQ